MPRYVLRPNGDAKAEWTEDPVGTAWSILDDAVEYPDAPTTGSDRITTTTTSALSAQDVETFTLASDEVVVAVRAWAYGKGAGSGYKVKAYENSSPAELSTDDYTSTSFGWGHSTYIGTLTQAQINALQVRIVANNLGGGTAEVNATYIEVVTQQLSSTALNLYTALQDLNPDLLWVAESSGAVMPDHSGNFYHGDLTGVAASGSTPLLQGGHGKVTQDNDSVVSGVIARGYKPYEVGADLTLIGIINKDDQEASNYPTVFAGTGQTEDPLRFPHPTWEFIDEGLIRFYAQVNTFPIGWVDADIGDTHDRTVLVDFEFNDSTSIASFSLNGIEKAAWDPNGDGASGGLTPGPLTGAQNFDDDEDPGYFVFGHRGTGTNPYETFVGSVEMVAVIPRALTTAERRALGLASGLLSEPSVIRQNPPVRLHAVVESPSGGKKRWATDEPSPDNVPSGISFSTTIPGGFEQGSIALPRKPKVSYSDVEPLSNLRILGAGGEPAWEGRIEGAPRSSGSEKSISVSAVGWQAALEDDQTAVMPYVDRDLSHWQESSTTRRVNLYALSALFDVLTGFSVESDTTSPAIRLNLDGRFATGGFSEALYDSKTTLGSVYYTWTGRGLLAGDIGSIDGFTDGVGTGAVTGTDVVTAASGTGNVTETSVSGKRWAAAHLYRSAVAATTDVDRDLRLSNVAVYGNHGLTKRGTEPAAGFYASDVIGHAVATWAPSLSLSVDQTGFVIPHIAFLDFTTAATIVREANRFHLNDWGVWDNKTFHYYQPGARGRTWRARVSEANLQEAGPQIDKVWNGVVVSYPDVDGTTRTVGPTGSVADSTSADLIDSDPSNPANAAGLRRWVLIQSSTVTTLAGATEIGRRFLVQSAQVNTSGQADIVGTVEDSKGVKRPAWQVRAGDYISFIDASDTSPRKIVRTSYDADSLTNSIDLDTPPEGLDALLERLSVVLVPLGL